MKILHITSETISKSPFHSSALPYLEDVNTLHALADGQMYTCTYNPHTYTVITKCSFPININFMDYTGKEKRGYCVSCTLYHVLLCSQPSESLIRSHF